MRYFYLLIGIISLLFSVQNLKSQDFSDFDVSNDYILKESVFQKYNTRLINMKDKYKNPKRKFQKKFEEICLERSKYFTFCKDNNLLMDDSRLVNFTQDLVDYIVKKNNLKRNYYKTFVVRSSVVNAANLGQGIIFINLGLLVRIKNVDELAFVLSHEIAHDLKNHIFKSTRKDAERNEKDLKRKLKKASKGNLGYSKQRDIVNQYLSSKMLHSRKNEFTADSKGRFLFLKAKFDDKKLFEALEMLDDSDQLLFKDTVDIISVLSTSYYQIKPRFLTEEDQYSSWDRMDDLYTIADSLKTHPNIDMRIDALRSKLSNNQVDNEYVILGYESFSMLENDILKEYLHCLIEEDQIGKVLYLASYLKSKDRNNPFFCAVICYGFYDLYAAIKTQSFSGKVAFPDESFNEGYNKFLEFLQAQNSKRFLKMANGQYKDCLENADDFEFKRFIKAYKLFLEDKKKPSELFKHIFYKEKFKKLL